MHCGQNRHSWRSLGRPGGVRTILVAAVAVFLPLVLARPSYPYSVSSHTEVQSDGTAHGWGITDATPPPGFAMVHTAYVRTTLTSPNGRTAYSGTRTGANVVRADVWLAHSPGDTGTFRTDSYHGAWCPVWQRWVIPLWGPHTSATATFAPYPINFTQAGSTAYSDGRLQFQYTWGSSSGSLPDLAECDVYETVTYPGPPGVYAWPTPPWQDSTANPEVGPDPPIPGSAGGGTDTHGTGSFNIPYGANSFDAGQVYGYSCPNRSGNLSSSINIHREVYLNGSYYTYRITKSGASATCTLGVNCYNH
jgi:hypothetical protein